MSRVPGCDAQNPSLQGANTWQRRLGSHVQAESRELGRARGSWSRHTSPLICSTNRNGAAAQESQALP